MSATGKTIIKNASVLMVSQLVTWALSLLLMVFLPRYLGATAVGALSIGQSLWTIVGVAITFGMDVFLLKEVARHPEKTADLLGTTLVVRGLLFGLGLIAVTLYLQLVDYTPMTVQVIYLMGLTQLCWQFINACTAALKGLEVMEQISISTIAGKAVHTGLGITLLLLGYGVYAIALVSMISALVILALQFAYLRRRYQPRLQVRFDRIRAILRSSTPYLLSALVLVIYMEADTIIVSLLANEQTVGWYSTARRLLGTLLFIPVVLIAAVFPALTRIYAHAAERLPLLIGKSFDMLMLISVPLGLGLMVIADPVVVLLFGAEFAPSGPVLAILGVVLIFVYLNVLVGQFLVSTDRQNRWTAIMAVATLMSIGLNIVLIPWTQEAFGNGAIGGALSCLVAESAMVAVGLAMLPRGSLGWGNLRTALLICAAGLAMVGAIWWWRTTFIAVPILIGAVTYGGLIALLRVVPREDAALAVNVARNGLRRLRRRVARPAV